ncbi:MAG: HlyD family type I secretion periplasmic adaptor subunit [Pseudomonadota bacterium]|jgi:protease secretion system membrane fusion protein
MLQQWFLRLAQRGKQIDTVALGEAELRQAVEDVSNPGRTIRWGVWLLGLGFGGFLVWAIAAPIDEGVPAPGSVVVDTKRKTVQHLTGGIVREILVREAQKVKAGDVLIRLDDTQAKANYQATRQQYFALLAQEGRLEAEQKGAAQIRFHPDLVAARDDPFATEHMDMQRRLFASRRAALQGELAILTQSLDGTREYLRGLEAQLAGKQAQLGLVRDQLAGTRELAKEGYLPRNRWYDEERLAAELAATVGDLSANIARTRKALSELELRIAQRSREFLRDVEAQLADTRRDAIVAGERWRVAREELTRTEIRSPADGFVVGLVVHTVGGVVTPGTRLMDIVPEDAALTLEVRVEPYLVDRVHADLPADILIHAFVDNPNLVVAGRVISVSADLVADQPNIPPYYLARVAVTPEGMKTLGSRQLQPGMPAEVVIKTGERTFIEYLLRPLIRRMAMSFREA